MSRHVLLAGCDLLLLGRLARRLLRTPDHRVTLAAPADAVGRADHLAALVAAPDRHRLRCLVIDQDGLTTEGHQDELWVVPLGPGGSRPSRAAHADGVLRHAVLTALPSLGHPTVNYVARRPSLGFGEATVRQVPPVFGGQPHFGRLGQPGPLDFMAAVRVVRDHVVARSPDYFRHHALRYPAPRDAHLRAAIADDAAEQLLRGSVVVRPSTLSLASVAEHAGRSCGLTVRLVDHGSPVNAVDRLLADELGDFPALLTHTAGTPPSTVEDVVPAENAPLIVVNALAQGPVYWESLLEELLPRRAVLVTPSVHGDLHDHVRELAAVLRAEGIDRCHLLGWCTAAKTLVRYYHQHPDAVLSLTFVNPSFRHTRTPAHLDSAYERELDTLSCTLAERPAIAARVRRFFTAAMFPTATDPVADEVLAVPHPDLDPARRAPFRDDDSFLTYATQLLAFWSHDVTKEMHAIHAPTLFLVGALDEIISPTTQHINASFIPAAQIDDVAAGTHYCMHERPRQLADRITQLCHDAETRARILTK